MDEKELKEEVEKELEETKQEIEEAKEQEDNFVKRSKERFDKDEMLLLIRPIEWEGNKIEELSFKGMRKIKGRHLQRAADFMREKGLIYDFSSTSLFESADFALSVYTIVTNTPPELIEELYSVDYFQLVNMCKRFLWITG